MRDPIDLFGAESSTMTRSAHGSDPSLGRWRTQNPIEKRPPLNPLHRLENYVATDARDATRAYQACNRSHFASRG